MRIGTHPDCSWYRHDARRLMVSFNGATIAPHLLLLADDDTGLLVTLKANANGSIFQDPNNEGETITVIQRGRVTIREPVVEEARAG